MFVVAVCMCVSLTSLSVFADVVVCVVGTVARVAAVVDIVVRDCRWVSLCLCLLILRLLLWFVFAAVAVCVWCCGLCLLLLLLVCVGA